MAAPFRRSVAVLPALLSLAAAAPAVAATGGTSVPANPPSALSTPAGGVAVAPNVAPPPKVAKKRVQMPTLAAFSVGASRFTDGGTLPVSFRMAGTTGAVRVKLGVYSAGKLVASFDLGRRSTGAAQRYTLSSASARKLPAGSLILKLSGLDARGHHLRGGLQASAAHVVTVAPPAPAPAPSGSHTFPLLGSAWNFGGAGARFGAPRSGHIHQGQDILAPSGTPIVAPAAGTVAYTAYQAAGAGYYVVMKEAGQDYSYAFMHLLAGSTAVHAGEQVSRGQAIGSVGATGDAQGPHLHFEIWQGPWQAGGHPIDPLPYLQQWAAGA
jgi:murein DD-endopeptidase MepM/ murein hydrolase activator NlpD